MEGNVARCFDLIWLTSQYVLCAYLDTFHELKFIDWTRIVSEVSSQALSRWTPLSFFIYLSVFLPVFHSSRTCMNTYLRFASGFWCVSSAAHHLSAANGTSVTTITNKSVDKKITQLRGLASRLGIRRVMICLKYCSSEHWAIPPMVRVNSFWSRRCQFGNRGDLCLILAHCNQENNRWLCLTGEPRTCQRNRWKFINNTPDSVPSWGEFFRKKACNPLFHPSQTCIQMQRGVFCNQGRERPQRKTILLRGSSFVVQDILWTSYEISYLCTTSLIKLIY